MKKYLFFAAALIGLASCTSDDFVGDQNLREANGQHPISFNSGVGAITRADATGATAASALGNQFIVYGEKNETSGSNPSTGNLVFQNYQVNYAASTANTTTSNTKDWEYVGYTHTSAYQSNITTSTTDAQTIKYWDYGASNYVFTAVSAQQSDITDGKVKITKTTSGSTVYDKGYSITISADADLSKLFIADREVINQGTGTDRTAINAYGGNVTLKFRNSLTQVRVGMYENIPGHTVTIDKFYYVDNANPTFNTMTTAGTDKFYANVPNVASGTAATLTVTYHDNSVAALENQPKITNSATAANYIALGDNLKANTVLATTSAAPTYDKTGGAFTSVFPQEDNTKNLKLKVDYTLTADVTGEIIKVTGATAEIPAEYLQWKPNFKYTYIFKISDNGNGSTGGGVVGLYPITFDAVEILASDGTADYITTVSEPSITTFGVSGGKYVSATTDYAAGCDVYATFMEGSTVQTPVIATNVNIYKVTTTDATNFPITEASVAESVANPTGNKITATLINTDDATNFTAAPSVVTTVPAEDGSTITIDALKLTGIKAGTYAVEYKASAAWTGTYDKVYKVIVVH